MLRFHRHKMLWVLRSGRAPFRAALRVPAAICSIDDEQPTTVCTSQGVTQAKSAGKITPTFIGGCRPTLGCAAPKQG